MSDLLIFDPYDNLLAVLSNEAEEACPFWDAPFGERLNNGSTFEFTAQGDHEDSQYIVAENQVAFLDKDGFFQLFMIKEPDYSEGHNGPQIHAVCDPWMNELHDEPIEDIRPYETTLRDALTRFLVNTRVRLGEVAELGLNSTNAYYTSVAEGIQNCINTWGGELRFRAEIEDGKITRYLDVPSRRGQDTGKRWEMDKDILSISHRVQSYPKTALYGRGSSLETENDGFTRKITFADVEWKVANGDPVDKPLGQEWVGDPGALELFGRLNEDGTSRHRFDFYENGDQEDPENLLEETWEALQDAQKQVSNFEMDVFLLEELTGYEHEKVRLGDTTFGINRNFAKPIEVEERVIYYEYDVSDPDASGTVELGQFIDLFEESDRLDKVESKLNDRTGIWNNPPPQPIDPNNYPDIIPSQPVVTATANFASVNLNWAYAYQEFYTQAFEVFVSEIQGFAVTEDNLIFRGIANGYNFVGEANKQYYFRVRAVNFHGRASPLSDEVFATTARIISDDILFGPDIAAELRKLSEEAGILGEGVLGIEQLKQTTLNQINQTAQDYTNEEIQKTTTAINSELADKAGLNYVNGKFSLVDSELSGILGDITSLSGDVSGITTDVGVLQDTASNLITRVGVNEDDLSAANGKLITMETDINTIEGSLSATINQLSVVEGTIADQQTQISANASAIELKASQEELDTVTGDISSINATLQVQAGEINAKAERTEVYTIVEVDGIVSTKISQAKAEIKVTTDGISQSVSDINQTVSGHTTAISNAESSIDQLSTSITLKAEKTEVEAVQGQVSSVSNQLSSLTVDVGEISTSVSSIRSDLNNIDIHPADSGKTFKNIFSSQRRTSSITGALIIRTPITSSYMTRIKITGYNYQTDKTDIDLTVSFYAYSSGAILSHGFLSSGSYPITKVQVARENGKAVIIINNVDSSWQYPFVSIDEAIISYGTPPDSYKDGWSVDYAAAIPGEFTNLTNLSGRDFNTSLSSAETSINQNATQIALKASQTAVDSLTGRMTQAESSLSVQADLISAKVDKDGVIAAINVSPGTVKIDAALIDLVGDVYITNGRTYISNGVVDTVAIANGAITKAKIGTAAVGNAQIENAAITSAKIASLSADKITSGVLSSITINGVTINGSKFSSVRDSSNYATIENAFIEARGTFTRTWQGNTFNHDVALQFQNGYFAARSLNDDRNLYYSNFGISTYASGNQDESSGTIEFFSYDYDPVRKGLTISSVGGVVALRSGLEKVIIDAYDHAYIRSNQQQIRIQPRSHVVGNNTFVLHVVDNAVANEQDGILFFGSENNSKWSSGLRFSKTLNSNTLYVTNGDGDRGTGNMEMWNLKVNNRMTGAIEAPTDNVYAYVDNALKVMNKAGTSLRNIEVNNAIMNEVIFGSLRTANTESNTYIGVGSYELRITNNQFYNSGNTAYRGIRASAFSQASSRKYKTNIEDLEDIGLDIVNGLKIRRFELIADVDEGKYNPRIGVIAEDSPSISTQDGMAIEHDKLTYFNTKAIQEVFMKYLDHDERINNLEMENQLLKAEIKQLKDAAA